VASAKARAESAAVPVVFLLLSAWICVEAIQVPLGSFRMPGAGFFPLGLGLTLGVLSIVLLGMNLRRPADGVRFLAPQRSEVLYLVGSLVAAVWLFERAGFVVTMALFVAVVLRVLGGLSWAKVVALGVVGSLAAYVVFSRVLLIALPSGVLPF
jgi:putative tricarboxylic transport membrane protein